MKVNELKMSANIFLSGGYEPEEFLEDISIINEDCPIDVAELIAQCLISEFAEDLEDRIDNNRNKILARRS